MHIQIKKPARLVLGIGLFAIGISASVMHGHSPNMNLAFMGIAGAGLISGSVITLMSLTMAKSGYTID